MINDRSGRLTIHIAALVLLLLALVIASRSFFASPTRELSAKPEHSAAEIKTNFNPQQADSVLGQLIEQKINQSAFKNARWGVYVIALKDGRVIYSHNGDHLFTPASNMKLYTTAVALDLLGANYVWRTSVYADKQIDANGTIKGDLILYGRGAPDLISESHKENKNSLSALADRLAQSGLRRVTGTVIGDESYFRGDPIGEGWQWNDLQWYFGAEASALSVNNNEVDVSIEPPSKSDEPPLVRTSDNTGLVHLSPRMTTVKSGERFRLGIHRGLSDNELGVWGEFPLGSKGYGAQIAVHRPALWTARLFLVELKKKGIIVEGEPVARDSRVPEQDRFNPSRSKELAFVSSKPLLEIVTATNKHSINLDSELLLRTLGRERGPMLQETPPGRERGDDEAGTTIIKLWLSRSGISTEGLAFHDGSGLSRLNLVSPQVTARLLLAISRTSAAELFRSTLPISGRDGTLIGRLRNVESRIQAKTGSLTYDNSLSGYVLAKNSETLAFSIICNDQTGPGTSLTVIDQIASLLSDYPHP